MQRGAFNAYLMAEPHLVADCVKAMVDVVDVPVTVKHHWHRQRLKAMTSCVILLEPWRKLVARPSLSMRAMTAWLKGLSPKENRDIRPCAG